MGGGSFGDIYLGVGSTGEKVAVKFEKHGARCPQLRHEYKVYRELQNAPGFARVHYFGTQDSYNLMVMDLLGPSLEDQFNKCSRRFTLKTVLLIADQMLERVELMHSRHLIHRDIKPANFVTDVPGSAAGTSVFCIDFGLSKRYRHPRTLQHIPQREGRSLTGTPPYASINNHQGVDQSRRDDLESIGYVLVYFLKGGLPWQGLKAKSASKKYKLIMEKKQSSSIPSLCQGCPNQFADYLAYCRHLKFDAKPNIAFLRGIFRDLFRSQGYTNNNANSDWDWDWNRIDGANAPEQPLGPAGREGENNGNGNGTEEVDDNSDDDDDDESTSDDDSYSEEEEEEAPPAPRAPPDSSSKQDETKVKVDNPSVQPSVNRMKKAKKEAPKEGERDLNTLLPKAKTEAEAGAGAGAAEVKHDMDSSLADQHWILDPR